MHAGAAFALSAALTFSPTGVQAAELKELGRFTWSRDFNWFGGWSGLDVADDGIHASAVSDVGVLVTGVLERKNGQFVDFMIDEPAFLTGPGKNRLDEKKHNDAEALVRLKDGSHIVSFEGAHRIYKYSATGVFDSVISDHPAPAGPDSNRGLEALAMTPDGTLVEVPEISGALTKPFQIQAFQDPAWEPIFNLPRSAGLLPVGADFGPDGHLYVLERGFNGIFFFTRIRRVLFANGQATRAETLWKSDLTSRENYEGITLWEEGAGTIKALIVSDDNFSALQRTQFIEFALIE